MNIDQIIIAALAEDLGEGDHTSMSTIPGTSIGKAQLLIKEKGVLAGINVARKVFGKVDKSIQFNEFMHDGESVEPGNVAFIVEGRIISLLSSERLALNFMQRMSGIATYTNHLVKLIEGTNAKILDTRKTTPLHRELEKQAVRIGGGYNHRMGLYDMIMIKDNHVDFAGGISEAIYTAKQYLEENNKDLKIEVEVRNISEVDEVMEAEGVDRIMFDNFTPDLTKIAVRMINGKFETESSGGITDENIRAYAETGVDFISVGALTHQIKSLDMSLKSLD